MILGCTLFYFLVLFLHWTVSLSLSLLLSCIRPAHAGSRMQQTVHFYVPSSAASPVKHIPIPTAHPMPVMIVDCLSAFLFALP